MACILKTKDNTTDIDSEINSNDSKDNDHTVNEILNPDSNLENTTECITDDDIPKKDESLPQQIVTKEDNSYERNDNEIDLDNPTIRTKTSININTEEYIVGCSLQGRSHIGVGVPCQDFHLYTQIAPHWHLTIVSDGAGSAKESERGSKANCEFATKLVTKLVVEKQWIENNYLPNDKEWYIEMRNVLELMQEIIKINTTKLNEATKNNNSNIEPLESRDFNATLLLILTTPKGMLTAHIGDGRMGYLSTNGEWLPLMTPHKGIEANETVFVPNNWNNQMEVPAFTMSGVYLPETMVITEKPKAIVIMSDGCEKFTWLCTAYDNENKTYYDRNRPFEGFLNPLIDEMNVISDPIDRVNRLIEIINLGTAEAKREQDDRTLLLGVFND